MYVSEELTARYTLAKRLVPIDCECAEQEGPRREIREFIEMMRSRHTDVDESVSAALGNVNPYTLFDAKLQKEGADQPVFAR